MPPLDELYGRLLFTYPSPYRQEHEAEIVSTLIEAAEPGQRWPSVREAGGLLVGGLRTRAVVASREGTLAIWADGLRLGVALLLGSLIVDAYIPFMYGSGTRARFLPVLLVLAAIAVMRGASRVGLVLVVAVGVAAWPYVFVYFGPGWLVSTSGWPAYEILSPPIAAVVLLWLSWGRKTGHAWSWWLVAPVVVCPVLYELLLTHQAFGTLDSALGFHVPLSLFELVLPALLLIAWSMIAADPRPSIGAALYVAVHLTAVAPGVAAQSPYALPLLVPAVLASATIAGAAVSSRRLAHG